jgi:hypothetical protein
MQSRTIDSSTVVALASKRDAVRADNCSPRASSARGAWPSQRSNLFNPLDPNTTANLSQFWTAHKGGLAWGNEHLGVQAPILHSCPVGSSRLVSTWAISTFDRWILSDAETLGASRVSCEAPQATSTARSARCLLG